MHGDGAPCAGSWHQFWENCLGSLHKTPHSQYTPFACRIGSITSIALTFGACCESMAMARRVQNANVNSEKLEFSFSRFVVCHLQKPSLLKGRLLSFNALILRNIRYVGLFEVRSLYPLVGRSLKQACSLLNLLYVAPTAHFSSELPQINSLSLAIISKSLLFSLSDPQPCASSSTADTAIPTFSIGW